MTSSIAAIHVAKKQLGLDEDTYRAKLQVITGKTSVKDMTEDERQKVISAFRQNGFKPVERRQDGRQKLTGQFAKKLQALWIGGYNLGVVENRDDTAMLAFVKRQTGLDHTRFLHYADDARKAIEGLKAWLHREAGVSFGSTNGYDWMAADGAKIAWAQWKLLNPTASMMMRKGFDDAALAIAGPDAVGMLVNVTPSAWQKVMNSLGEQVRAMKKAGR
jgi:phage gp16-like protein